MCLNTGWPISWRTWVGLTLILGVSPGWWAATVATYCLSRMEEHPKTKSTKPSPPGDGPPCTHHSILMYAHILPNHLHPILDLGIFALGVADILRGWAWCAFQGYKDQELTCNIGTLIMEILYSLCSCLCKACRNHINHLPSAVHTCTSKQRKFFQGPSLPCSTSRCASNEGIPREQVGG